MLATSYNLQKLTQFLEALKNVKPREGRALNLEVTHATPDFGAYFQELPTAVSGDAHTKGKTERGEETVHVFIFQLRKNLASTFAPVEETFPKCSPHEPQVFLPHDGLQVFDPAGQGPKRLRGRRALTRGVATQPPWNIRFKRIFVAADS